MLQFPHNFLWGAATSAYQVEGNNLNSDWWEWERRVGLKEISGEATRHYQLYKADFDLAKLLNHNCHRLSIEWSRIEPKEGKFLNNEIDHYIDVILSLRQRNLEPLVTLHHFTNPLWFSRLGGWLNKKAVDYFLRYVERIVEPLCDQVKYWITINEPIVYMYYAYMLGKWPPQEKSFFKAAKVKENLILAHIRSYKLIHEIYKKRNLVLPSVSLANNTMVFVPCSLTLRNKIATYLRDREFNFEFIEKLIRAESLDFVGINYYTRSLIDIENYSLRSLLLDTCKKGHSNLQKNSLGWDIYPEGLYNLLLRLKKYNLPIFILENGICTEDDNMRWNFIYEHLKNIHQAMEKGVNVLGYVYWSLLDNFEWDKGFSPRFGLIELDYSTHQRTIRESAKKFALVCKNGRLD